MIQIHTALNNEPQKTNLSLLMGKTFNKGQFLAYISTTNLETDLAMSFLPTELNSQDRQALGGINNISKLTTTLAPKNVNFTYSFLLVLTQVLHPNHDYLTSFMNVPILKTIDFRFSTKKVETQYSMDQNHGGLNNGIIWIADKSKSGS